jgi:hypothetical protein
MEGNTANQMSENIIENANSVSGNIEDYYIEMILKEKI